MKNVLMVTTSHDVMGNSNEKLDYGYQSLLIHITVLLMKILILI